MRIIVAVLMLASAAWGQSTIGGVSTVRLRGKYLGDTVAAPTPDCFIRWIDGSAEYRCVALTGAMVATTPAGGLAAADVAAALNELDTEKLPTDPDLVAIGGLTCADGQGPKKVSGSWTCQILVDGPASAVDNRVAAFDGTSGNKIKDSGRVYPSGSFVGTFDTQTLSFKTLLLPIISSFTVAGLAGSSASANNIAVVTDGLTAGDCTTGGGTALALCRYNGTAWVPLGDGGSGSSTVYCATTDTGSTATMATPCTVRAGIAAPVTLSSSCVFTPSSGTGVASFTFLPGTGFVVYHNVTASVSGDCTAVGSTTVPPRYAFVIATAVVTSNVVASATQIAGAGFSFAPAINSDSVSITQDSDGNDVPAAGATSALAPRQWRTWESHFFKLTSGDQADSNNNAWIISDATGTPTYAAVDATDAWGPGQSYTTDSTSGTTTGVRPTNGHTALEAGLDTAGTGTEFGFEVATLASITSMRIQARYLPGGISRVTAEPGATFGWIYDTANGTSGANWLIQVCTATPTCTYTDTGVAVATSTKYQLVLTKAASGWDWSIRSGASHTLADSGNFSPTIVSTGMGPVINVVTTSSAARGFTAIRHWARRPLY